MSTEWNWATRRYQSQNLAGVPSSAETVADRQDRVPGFSTAILQKKKVLLVGAGGLGGAIAPALVRKGIGELHICDPDLVEISNLNRQVFYKEDLHRPKAICLAKNAAREGFLETVCVGHYVGFDETSGPILVEGMDVVVVGVDNNETRAIAARIFRKAKVPAVFTAVNEAANFGYVFVHEVGGPCLACVFPRTATVGQRQPCRPSPAVIDILHVVGGMVTYAVDTLLMNRPRGWNFRSVDLVGNGQDPVGKAQRQPNCPLCGDDVP